MNKRCTNSSCRKTFSTLTYGGTCPFCGKVYPQLVSARRSVQKMNLWIDGNRMKFRLDEVERYRLHGRYARGVISVKREFERQGYTVSLRAARDFYKSFDGKQYRMVEWRKFTDPETGDRKIEPVYRGSV